MVEQGSEKREERRERRGEEEELTLSSCHPLHANPPEQKHAGMVVDMQECNLFIFLAKYEEKLISRGERDVVHT